MIKIDKLRATSPAPPTRSKYNNINPTVNEILIPDIKPVKCQEYDIPCSKYPQCGKLPLRQILLGPSGSGKGILLQNMILDVYRGCFERVFIWSPSINLDDNWKPVKEYLNDDKLMPNKNGDKLYYDEYKHDELAEVIEKQKKVVEYQKSDKQKKYSKF